MPYRQTHHMKLSKRTTIDPQDCAYVGSCSCQWQALAHTLDRLEGFAATHQCAQMSIGHSVIIEREESLV